MLRSVVIPELPKVGFTGVRKLQMLMDEVLDRYTSSPSSELQCTGSSSSRITTTSKALFRTPAYYPPFEDVAGSLVVRDANRMWQVALFLSEPQFRDRQRVPPSKAGHAQLQKVSIVAHLSRNVRAFDVDIGEQAWERRVRNRMALTHDNYLRSMQNNLTKQFPEKTCTAYRGNLGNP